MEDYQYGGVKGVGVLRFTIPLFQYSIIPCTKAELAFMRLSENVILSPPQAGEESRTPEYLTS
jgi:hypothetical protein